jgi:ribonucleoside-triphosphate reductase
MVTSDNMCRTVNGLDVNALDNFKANVQHALNKEFDKIDDVFSGVQKDGRGNICPTTIIMPTLAAMVMRKLNKKFENTDLTDEAKREMVFREFMNLLDKKIHEAKDMLLERFNHICSQSPKSARFMYENHAMAGYHEEEGIISALKHGTLVIGQLGMSETLYILFGFDHTTEEGMKYAKEIEKMFNVRCGEFKQEYKLNFGVYYTPAENLCYTSFKKFCKMFPEFDLEGVTYFINENGEKEYKEYFTNSIHVPVYHKCDPFEKIDIESQLTGLSNAGCITYVEINNNCYYNIDAIEKIVDYAMEHDIPYMGINIVISQCHNCGERIWDSETKKCPKCGCEEIDKLGRVCGYLSTTYKHFNKGKQVEFLDRVKHIKN